MREDSEWRGQPERALLAEKEEDRFTVLLCELLRSRDVLTSFLELSGVSLGDKLTELAVGNQVTVPGGRPDLVIRGAKTYLMFEAKVGSWLHDGQIPAYLEALSSWAAETPKGVGRLTLIAPRSSCEPLTQEANLVASNLGTPEVRPIAWEAIASRFEVLAKEYAPSNLRSSLELFVGLVAARLGTPAGPFTKEEIGVLSDPLLGRAYQRLWGVCSDLLDRLKGTAGVTIEKGTSNLWQGNTLRKKGRWWWLGLWPEVWEQTGTTPLVLQTPGLDGQSPRLLENALPRTVAFSYFGKQRMLLPLPIVADEAPELLRQRLYDIIRRVIEEHPDTGGKGEVK
jgi:hypothetical protein